MSLPKISVIMSVYNGMPFLKDAVESILIQTYKNFEFIIVDYASTDNSWNYLKSLKDKRIKLIKNKKNLGLASSLNIALRQVFNRESQTESARGDYIARMDADDISLPKRFEEQVNFLHRNPKVMLCGTWVDLINDKGQKIGEKKYPTEDSQIKKSLAWYPAIVHPTFMSRKGFYKTLNGYDTDFDFAEEYELMMRAKNKFKMANIPKKLLYWRFWDNRRSREFWDKMERVDFKIKLEAFKRKDFGLFYFFILLGKFFITFILPYKLKLIIFKTFKMI